MRLTEGMKRTLNQIGYGVRGYEDGKFHPVDAPKETVDMRSAQALYRRGLVVGAVYVGRVELHRELLLTDEGSELFEEMRSRGELW